MRYIDFRVITTACFKYLLPIYLILLWSCSQPTKNSTETFIVPVDTIMVYTSTENGLPPSPPPPIFESYYFSSNFIIDTGGHIYFYQQPIHYGMSCVTILNQETPPLFIDLKPKDIIEVPDNDLEQFIKLNIQYIEDSKRRFSVASTVDTVTSAGLAKIFKVLKDTTNHIRWEFRRATQEENVVLEYKKRKERYDYQKIKWDSTKIIF